MAWSYKNAILYLKSSGLCVILVSGCWIIYQIRQTKLLLDTVIPTKVLDAKPARAQYIYIDHPSLKDIFMFSHTNDLHSNIQDKPQGLSYVISKWWKTLNRNLAMRQFQLANTGDKIERRKAIFSLSSQKHLKDWHYCQIAQMLDAKTAVALARSQADLRFFLKPPYFFEECKFHNVVENLHELLIKLNKLCGGCHPCLSQFLLTRFQVSNQKTLTFDHELTNTGLPVPPTIAWDQEFLFSCVQAVHHHSSLEEHSKDIADAGGLKIIMNVYKLIGNANIDLCILLAKILSNLSLHPEYLEDIFKSGWIGILAAWSRHEDFRLAAVASRALANLDFDENDNEKYAQRIYPLYPLHRVNSKRKLDIIFIHGLLGGVFVTWRQRDSDIISDYKNNILNPICLSEAIDVYPSEFVKDLARDLELLEWERLGSDFEVILHDCPVNASNTVSGPFFCKGDEEFMNKKEMSRTKCWPKDWLPEDVPNLRILGINYSSNLSLWTPLCPIEGVRSTIKERSIEFTRKLVTAGVGKRSIVWACHSMGGLLVKKMLVEEWKSGDKHKLVQNTKGIVFYSTPHRGSHIAAFNQTTQMLVWPSVEVQELREQSPQLLQLHEDFLKMLNENEIEVISFGETKATPVTALKVPFRFVKSESADPNVGEFFEIAQDHLSICKPANRQSFLYQKVLALIKRHVESNQKEEHKWYDFFLFPKRVL